MISLLISCFVPQQDTISLEKTSSQNEIKPGVEDQLKPEQETQETQQASLNPSNLHQWHWKSTDSIDLTQQLVEGKGRIKILDPKFDNGRLLLAVDIFDEDHAVVSGTKTKKIFTCEMGMKPSLIPLHTFDRDTRVWSAVEG